MSESVASSPPGGDPFPGNFLTYEQFGRRFFEIAVTEQRVGAAIGEIAGEAFEMGPIAQGPGRIAKVTAKVRIQQPKVTRDVGELITFAIRIPLEIDMVVDLRIDKPKFMVFGEISLRATAKAAEPLLLILDVEKPRASDIAIHVTSKSLRGEVVRIIGGVDAEIKRFIALHVAGEIDSPGSQEAKVIDVAETIADTWTGV
ncbi:hypothetical protein [Mycolicibacterium iranicum]|uniref:Uncharacterized protein n=1 Tax=Mycolicibacterium iranicum TaxID=912594 RepID=A0A1X1W9G9_MYCIR|nr:hypothetical protein [Mycolicibacterium iranicum]MCZ0730556.1 hypothetical protein [Mycolicibacterium iranicum]ORV83168.1 hypothetical protein AWC12_26455 [Mycolicibacterium iranicum]